MPDVKLNFINHSNNTKGSPVLIFQKNLVPAKEETAIAWLVIKNCGQGWNHPFIYPAHMYVSTSDSCGNNSPLLVAANGKQFSVVENFSEDIQHYINSASSQNVVEVLNARAEGDIDANIFNDGRLLATTPGIAPGHKAAFEFKPTIYIGVVSKVEEGDVIGYHIISEINTEISLFGIKSADIVMTGGETEGKYLPHVFTLQNIVYA